MNSTPNTIRVTESKKMRQAEHVARLGKSKCSQGFDGKI